MSKSIQSNFLPLLVQNNTGGADAKVLKLYEEPSWNNPVVRFIGADGKDLIARKDRVYSAIAIEKRMKEALSVFSKSLSG